MSTNRRMTTPLCGFVTMAACLVVPMGLRAQDEAATPGRDLEPLAAKEQMILDRFQRFQDRLFRLSEELAEREPDNAMRLARALSRAGEFGLAEQLDEIVKMLNDSTTLHEALDSQSNWLENADRILGILLERDSDNQERRSDIERLERYRQEVARLLDEQRELRGDTEESLEKSRLKEQIEQALRDLDAIASRQAPLGGRTPAEGGVDGDQTKALAEEQQRLAEETKQLSDDVARLGEQPSIDNEESSSLQQARSSVGDAGKALGGGATSMQGASQSLQQGDAASAREQQREAQDALQQARERLEQAREALEEGLQEPSNAKMAEQQGDMAQRTEQLAEQMKQEASQQGGGGGPAGGKPGSAAPGQQNLQKAGAKMQDAAQALGRESPREATPPQDRAIDELEQAQKELEEKLQQLRQEEREEMLRDLEARFRDMLARQRPINQATIALDQLGRDQFQRAEKLQLADLAAGQTELSEQAYTCLHILDEEGTTIAFPRIVGQLSEDMAASAERLSAAQVGTITQTIQKEIVDTLEQLLEAVKRMQQENEQSQQQASNMSDQTPPLLPKSAELKLLRSSQERINVRTLAVEAGRKEGVEPPEQAANNLEKLAHRQAECMEIAQEMRDRNP